MTKKSGLADSPFFKMPSPQKVESAPPVVKKKTIKKKKRDTVVSRHHDTMTPRNHDTKQPRYHDTIVRKIAQAVSTFGKEAATHRFTVEEKRAIKKIAFNLEEEGITTTENEIVRIAINHIVDDYNENGKDSLLHKVIQSLK